ncbi:MAG: tRNA (adenosine(37)-N6)-threonylcarbamoyltransferase complex ATPase subunit type 1 TsaE [Clostridia bacterium]|nr:tRNA (adenosine(37)-N6)-threonylcarbamoyltransferase complex ATPase subunit type 1 TsaE [Clostridia bacterium]
MKIIVRNLEQTQKLAIEFANTLRVGDIVLLSGDLGAGKTTFTQFVFKHLGVQGVVNSPTFAVLKTYEANGITLNHFDTYRINTAEAIECGFDEVISSGEGITFIEWSENIKELLPSDCIKVNIALIDNNRQFEITR